MIHDLIIIGGGPAGLMAAGYAAENGAKVLLLEKNKIIGIKLLSTGKERCNLTNDISVREMVNAFGPKGNFLFSAMSQFSPSDTIEFFQSRGVPIKVEKHQRAFPVSDKARDVLDVLMAYVNKHHVELSPDSTVKEIVCENNKITKLILTDGRELSAKNYILATGGKSYPMTGSTGDGYTWLSALGHSIVTPLPAIVPIIVSDKIVKELEGVSLSEAKFTFKKDNKIIETRTGDAVFTSKGLSGPAILAASSVVSRALPGIKVYIDFLPDESEVNLDSRFQKLFAENTNRQIKNVFSGVLPPKLTLVLLQLATISPDEKINQITRSDRQNLVKLIKNLEMQVERVDGFFNAMVTTGGLDLKEVDSKTMKSKLIHNLYLAGEILDLDGPTGGYNLQSCWSTGRLAGISSIQE